MSSALKDVLILRTYYVYENYPALDVLVTTFNRPVYEQRLKPELAPINDRVDVHTFDAWCSAIYKKKHNDRWIKLRLKSLTEPQR